MATSLKAQKWNPVRGYDDTSPPQDVRLDMASNLLNIERTDRGVKKRGGIEVSLSSAVSASADILHQDTFDLSDGTTYEVFFDSNGKGYYQSDPTQFIEGFASGEPVYTEQFLDTLIIAQGVTAMRTWDGTSTGTISASPKGKYIATHLEKLWTAGIDGQLSLVSVSTTGDFNTWSGDGTADINISQNDGQEITGLAVFRNDMIVFKENSIYKIIGFTSTTFQVINVAKNIGCTDHRTIRNTGDFLIFAYLDGVYIFDGQSAKKISAYQDDTWSGLNRTRFDFFDSTIMPDAKMYLLTVPTGSGTTNSKILTYYYDDIFQDDTGNVHLPCFKWEGIEASSLHASRTGSTNSEILYLGGYLGQIYKQSTEESDLGVAIETFVDSPLRSDSSIAQTKNQRRMYIPMVFNVGTVNVYYNYLDNDTDWTLAEAIEGEGGIVGDGIGVDFEIGVSSIGSGGGGSDIFRVNFNGVQARRIKTRISQTSASRTWEINGAMEFYDKFRGHKDG